MSFSSLGLLEPLQRAVAEQGYTTPSPIQAQAIPAVLAGRDLMAAAQTGTGKTAGFTLPLLQRLMGTGERKRVGHNQVRALVLTPTRELAAQVGESVATYGKFLPLRHTVVFGGVGINPQMMALRKGVDVLIACPGRLLDLHSQNAVRFDELEILVLDEADRMLDMGFIHDIRRILRLLPANRQNLLFSATFAEEIRELATSLLKDPLSIEVAPRNTTAERIEQVVHPVDKGNKPALLCHLVKTHGWEQVLVFTRTKHIANRLAEKLEREGVRAAAIHGNKSQGARTSALAGFKSGEIRVLVATDIAARGLDIDKLPQVVNFELPNVPEDYVHRIGRTGRAGAAGHAISLVAADEGKLLRNIEKVTKQEITREVVAGFEPDAATVQAIKEGSGQPARKGQEGGAGNNNRARPGNRQGQRGQAASAGRGGASTQGDQRKRNVASNKDGAKPSRPAGANGGKSAPDRHPNQSVRPHGNR